MGNSRTTSPMKRKKQRFDSDSYRNAQDRSLLNKSHEADDHAPLPGESWIVALEQGKIDMRARCPGDVVRIERPFQQQDMQADARAVVNSLEGGFKPSKVCPKHFLALSVNGTCSTCNRDRVRQ